jgi:hypothetical protein
VIEIPQGYKLKLNAKMLYELTLRATDCPDNNTKLVDSIASSSKNGTSPSLV